MYRCRLGRPAPGDLTLDAGARIQRHVGGGRLSVERKLPFALGDRDIEVGDAASIGDIGTEPVGAHPEPGVGSHRSGHVHGRPTQRFGRRPAGGVIDRVAGAVDGRCGTDRAGPVDPDVRQHHHRHEPDRLARPVGSAHLERVGPGLGRCVPVGGGPHHLELHTADCVLRLGDTHQALRHHVAVAQRREFAARPVDHGAVACEFQAGDRAGRADILDEHLHPEVHRDVAAPCVLTATEQ